MTETEVSFDLLMIPELEWRGMVECDSAFHTLREKNSHNKTNSWLKVRLRDSQESELGPITSHKSRYLDFCAADKGVSRPSGGGRRLERTALWAEFPANSEPYREFCKFDQYYGADITLYP